MATASSAWSSRFWASRTTSAAMAAENVEPLVSASASLACSSIFPPTAAMASAPATRRKIVCSPVAYCSAM